MNSATIASGPDSPAMSQHSKRSVGQYYAEYPEHDRLSSARGQLEFERTKRIVQRFLPTLPAIVADVGGGTRAYRQLMTQVDLLTRQNMQTHRSAAQVQPDSGPILGIPSGPDLPLRA